MLNVNTLLKNFATGDGALSGEPLDLLIASGGDPGVLRPFIGSDGKSYVTLQQNDGSFKSVLINVHATLRKDDWKILDDSIVKAATERLRLVTDLRSAGLTFTIPQGMGKTVLETETVSDVNEAVTSMDGLRESPDDRPEFELTNLPLPITHKDFMFSARQILASRNGGSPLDTTSAELAGRMVAEKVERLTLGRDTGTTFGGGVVSGLLNFASTITYTLTTPVGAGATMGATLLADVIAMRQAAVVAFHYGPYMLYVAPNWDTYLDVDFKANSDKTVRERVKAVNNIMDIRTLDFMQNYDIVLVQMTSDIIRMVIGMDITTLQWDTKGGMQKNFKVMTIMVPQCRADFNGNTGIVYGSI